MASACRHAARRQRGGGGGRGQHNAPLALPGSRPPAAPSPAQLPRALGGRARAGASLPGPAAQGDHHFLIRLHYFSPRRSRCAAWPAPAAGCPSRPPRPAPHARAGCPARRGRAGRPLPARMSRSSWFVGPSCRDVAMLMPPPERLRMELAARADWREGGGAGRTRGSFRTRRQPRRPGPRCPTTQRGGGGGGSASSSAAHAILPPPAPDRKCRAATHRRARGRGGRAAGGQAAAPIPPGRREAPAAAAGPSAPGGRSPGTRGVHVPG